MWLKKYQKRCLLVDMFVKINLLEMRSLKFFKFISFFYFKCNVKKVICSLKLRVSTKISLSLLKGYWLIFNFLGLKSKLGIKIIRFLKNYFLVLEGYSNLNISCNILAMLLEEFFPLSLKKQILVDLFFENNRSSFFFKNFDKVELEIKDMDYISWKESFFIKFCLNPLLNKQMQLCFWSGFFIRKYVL